MNQIPGPENPDSASTRAPVRFQLPATTPYPATVGYSADDSGQAHRAPAESVSRRRAITEVTASATLGAIGLSRPARAKTLASSRPNVSPSHKKRTANTFLAASQEPADFSLPAELAAVPFDPQAGFDLPVGRFCATFLPRAGLLGPNGEPARLLQEPMIMGMVVTCLKDIWWIESAPSGDQTFTMVAYAADGAAEGDGHTAVLSGQGVVPPEGGHTVQFSLQTVPALAGSEHHDQIIATVMAQPDGSYEGQVQVIEEKYHKGHGGHGKCHHRCSHKSGKAHRRCKHRCRKHR